MKNIFTSVLLCAVLPLFSQVGQSFSFRIPPAGISDPAHPGPEWNTALMTIEEPDPASGEGMVALKDSLAAIYRNPSRPHYAQPHTRQSASSPAAPTVNRSFAGNSFSNSTPCDNEIAIANNGQLISTQNTNLYRYNAATNTPELTQSLGQFTNALGNSASKYDPKVAYDPQADRFIFVCLAGFASNSTNIIIGFSRSDTANGLWNLYELPGNPLDDSLWSDYPMISINDNELFITVNLLHDNMPWQTGFVQSIVWQVNKWDGYHNDSLSTQLHTGITYGGNPVRDLCPVEGGSDVFHGPDMYFISNRNLTAANDSFFIVHITDTTNAVNQQVTVTPVVSNREYFAPLNAREPGNAGNLATNDARVQGAFLQNGLLQFVNCTMDTLTGNSAVYHGIISNMTSTPSLTAYLLSDTALEFGYPNIAYAGYDGSDNAAMICFLHSDSTTFPGVSVVVSDGSGNYSSRTVAKSGLGYIDVLSGDERWGDYSGIQRKYDQLGTCWVNGMYGLSNHLFGTWIAELGRSADVGVSPLAASPQDVSVFPNPFGNSITVDFSNGKAQRVRFVLYDISGKAVQLLLDDKVDAGKLRFTFSPRPLAKGIYLFRAEAADGSVLFTQRVVKN